MSKPRYDWWSYAKRIAEKWEELKTEYDDLHKMPITPNMSGMPAGGNGADRSVENIALRTLPGIRQKEYDAARFALEEALRRPYKAKRKKIIKMVFWDRSMTIAGAGEKVGYAERTARRICWCYILAIGRGMDFITQNEYLEALKKENN